MFRDFVRQAGQEWGRMERRRGQQGAGMTHAVTGEGGSKPVTSPPAQETHLSCIGRRERGGMVGGV